MSDMRVVAGRPKSVVLTSLPVSTVMSTRRDGQGVGAVSANGAGWLMVGGLAICAVAVAAAVLGREDEPERPAATAPAAGPEPQATRPPESSTVLQSSQ
jgi:hypothetical protein